MADGKREDIRVVCLYDSKDPSLPDNKSLKDQLHHHLNLKRTFGIDPWYIDDVLAGTDLQIVNKKLAAADIIIFLVTASFISSEKYSALIDEALSRNEKNNITLIPVLLKACAWKSELAFKGLTVLPKNEKAVTSWNNHAEAFSEIANEIREVVKQFKKKSDGLRLKDEAREYATNREYKKAEDTFQEALEIFQDDMFLENSYIDTIKFEIFKELGEVRCKRERWNLALEAYDHALKLNSKDVELYLLKSAIFLRQKKFEKAQEACQKAIQLDPQNPDYHRYLGKIFHNCGRYEHAHKAYETALQLKPTKEYYIHRENGDALYALKFFKAASDAYDKALESYNGNDPNFVEQTNQKLEDAQKRRSRQLLRDDPNN